MATGTTSELNDAIAKLRIERRNALALLKKAKIANLTVGGENEYQLQGLIGGIESLLIDIGALIKAERTLLSMSSFGERKSLLSSATSLLTNVSALNAHLNVIIDHGLTVTPQFQYTHAGSAIQLPVVEILNSVEGLKPLLRSFRIKEAPERFQELSEQVQAFIRAKLESEALIEQIGIIRKKGEGLQQELVEAVALATTESEEIGAIGERAKVSAAAAEENRTNVGAVLMRAEAQLAEMEEVGVKLEALYSDAGTQSAVIDQLSKRAESRNLEFDKQSSLTEHYKGELKKFEELHKQTLAQLAHTSGEAKKMLNVAGEVALGSHFNRQYEAARKGQWLWIVLSIAMFLIAIALGYETVMKSGDDSIAYLRRFTLVPLALLGAYFFGRQYERQKNITEDYAHKKVLALSLTSFRDQLADPANPAQLEAYMQKVLNELHRYPISLQPRVETIGENGPLASLKDVADTAKAIKDAVIPGKV